MDLLEENLLLLSEVEPALADLLRRTAGDDELEAATATSGLPTLRYRGRYVHSRRDPVAESTRLAEHVEYANCFVVLGFGLGYHCEAILRRYPDSVVVAVVRDAHRIRRAFELRDLRRLATDERLRLVVAPETGAIATILKPFEHMTIRTVSLPGLSKDDPFFDSIETAVSAFVERRTINMNTLRRFGRRWVRNLVANLPIIGSALGVDRAEGRFRGIPALVIAAGPSLDEVLPYLPELSRRCLTIAVDTALPKMREVGVEADIGVIVDPQYWNSRHLDRMSFSETVLVSESSTHPRVFRAFSSVPLLSSSLFPLGSYVERFLGGFGRLGAGGSVTTTAWDLGRILGCGPILLAGMDLGFPGSRTHCRGSFFEERAHTLGDRLLPAEQRAFAYLRDGGPFRVPANDGSKVITDRRMQLYRWWFENQSQIHPEVETINLSSGGVALDGIPHQPVESFLSLSDRRREVSGLLNSLRHPWKPRGSLPEELRTGLRELLGELTAIEADLSRSVALLEERPAGSSLSHDSTAELRNIDERLLGNPNREIVAFLALDEAQAVVALGETPDKADEAERRALNLYRSLLGSVRYHRDAIKGALREK